MKEKKILTNVEKEQVVAGEHEETVATQEEAKNEVVAEAAVEEVPAEAEDNAETTLAELVVQAVPPRPHKPHNHVRPCPNWDKYHPGSSLLKKGERPCQGWTVKSGTSQCYNCFLEERYVHKEEAVEQPQRITYGVIHEALEAAKGFFQQVTDDFKETSQARKAASILNSAFDSFAEGPGHYAAAYQGVQEAVPFLLSSEAQWLENELRYYLKNCGREAEFGKYVDRAATRYTEAVVHAKAEAEKKGQKYPCWVPPFDLRKEYQSVVVRGRRQAERQHYVDGLRHELTSFFPEQKGKDRRK